MVLESQVRICIEEKERQNRIIVKKDMVRFPGNTSEDYISVDRENHCKILWQKLWDRSCYFPVWCFNCEAIERKNWEKAQSKHWEERIILAAENWQLIRGGQYLKQADQGGVAQWPWEMAISSTYWSSCKKCF